MEGLNKGLENTKKEEDFSDIKDIIDSFPYSYSEKQIIEEFSDYDPEKMQILKNRFDEYNEFKLKKTEHEEKIKNLDEKYLINNEQKNIKSKSETNKEILEKIKLSFNESYLVELIKRYDENIRKGKGPAYWIEVGANKMTNKYYMDIGKKIPNNTKSDQDYQKIKNTLKDYYYNNFVNKEPPKNYYDPKDND